MALSSQRAFGRGKDWSARWRNVLEKPFCILQEARNCAIRVSTHRCDFPLNKGWTTSVGAPILNRRIIYTLAVEFPQTKANEMPERPPQSSTLAEPPHPPGVINCAAYANGVRVANVAIADISDVKWVVFRKPQHPVQIRVVLQGVRRDIILPDR